MLFHENHFITDFKEKAELFNSFFSNQCSSLKNCNKLPTNLRYVTDKRLCTINFTADNIEKIILSLNPSEPMVMTTSVYVCLKYVPIPFVNLLS